MEEIESGIVDMVLTDPPYGTTACKWDTIIPLEPMWEQLKRVTKKNGAIVMTASQPFTSVLVTSNIKMFKYEWIWDKVTARGHLVAKIRPMAQHEDVVVFGSGKLTYNPQMTQKSRPERGREFASSSTSIMPEQSKIGGKVVARDKSYPKTIQTFGMDKRVGHPTQKPVALMEYLIKTYTNEGETVLDFTMGSGTTGVAAINTNRNFIGIELDAEYFSIAESRIKDADPGNTLEDFFT
jgi:site-specific DNA-methyltransferase (adenine-specific)